MTRVMSNTTEIIMQTFIMAAASLHSPRCNNTAGFSWKDTVSLRMRIKFQKSGGGDGIISDLNGAQL